MDHPWRRLRHLTQWDLVWRDDLPVEILARTDHAARRIEMRSGLLQAQRRATLCHELEHVERGPVPVEPVLRAREELVVERASARRLISIEALGEALAWSCCRHEVADELWVDVAALEARLAGLHPTERAYLRQRLKEAYG